MRGNGRSGDLFPTYEGAAEAAHSKAYGLIGGTTARRALECGSRSCRLLLDTPSAFLTYEGAAEGGALWGLRPH